MGLMAVFRLKHALQFFVLVFKICWCYFTYEESIAIMKFTTFPHSLFVGLTCSLLIPNSCSNNHYTVNVDYSQGARWITSLSKKRKINEKSDALCLILGRCCFMNLLLVWKLQFLSCDVEHEVSAECMNWKFYWIRDISYFLLIGNSLLTFGDNLTYQVDE